MKHAARCMARLRDAIVGFVAAARKKLIWGIELCVRGIDFALSERGFQSPAKEKGYIMDTMHRAGVGHRATHSGGSKQTTRPVVLGLF